MASGGASRDYKLVYTSENADILTKTGAVIAELMKLDQLADRIKVKLKSMMTGVGPAFGNASRSANTFGGSLGTVATNANAATSALNGTTTAATGAGAAMRGLRGNVAGVSTSLGRVGIAALALHEARQVGDALGDAFKTARQYAEETAAFVNKIADGTRELAALRNQTPGDKLSAEVIKLMTESGATEQQASEFVTMFESTIPAAVKKGNILPGKSKAEQDEMIKFMEVETAKFAIRTGMDPKTAAETAGGMAIAEPIRSKGQFLSGLGTFGAAFNEGLGHVSALAKTAAALRGTMVRKGGAVENFGELSAIVGVGSINDTPEASKHRIDQAWRELNKFGDKKHDAFYQKVGITPDMNFLQRIERVAPFINEANKPGGKGAQAALYGEGLHLSAANDALIKFTGELPVLQKEVAKARTGADPNRVVALNRQFAEEDKTGRFAEAQKVRADFLKGLQHQEMENYRKTIVADMINRRQLNTPMAEMMNKFNNPLGLAGMANKSGRDIEIDKQMATHLIDAAKRTGVPLGPHRQLFEETATTGAILGDEKRAAAYRELIPKIRGAAKARGIADPFGVDAEANRLMNDVNFGAPAAIPAQIPGAAAAGARPAGPGAGAPPAAGPAVTARGGAGMGGDRQVVPLLKELVAMERRKERDRGSSGGERIPPDAGGGSGPAPAPAPRPPTRRAR